MDRPDTDARTTPPPLPQAARRLRTIARELEDAAVDLDGRGDGQLQREIFRVSREIHGIGERAMARARGR